MRGLVFALIALTLARARPAANPDGCPASYFLGYSRQMWRGIDCCISYMHPAPYEPEKRIAGHWDGVTQWVDDECGVCALQFEAEWGRAVTYMMRSMTYWQESWQVTVPAHVLQLPNGMEWRCPADHYCGYVINPYRWNLCQQKQQEKTRTLRWWLRATCLALLLTGFLARFM